MEESPHKCPVCSRSFNQRSNLKTHLLTHTDHKPYECSSCGKVFRRNCDLRRHALTHAVGDVPSDFVDVGEEDDGRNLSGDEEDSLLEVDSPRQSPIHRVRSTSPCDNEETGEDHCDGSQQSGRTEHSRKGLKRKAPILQESPDESDEEIDTDDDSEEEELNDVEPEELQEQIEPVYIEEVPPIKRVVRQGVTHCHHEGGETYTMRPNMERERDQRFAEEFVLSNGNMLSPTCSGDAPMLVTSPFAMSNSNLRYLRPALLPGTGDSIHSPSSSNQPEPYIPMLHVRRDLHTKPNMPPGMIANTPSTIAISGVEPRKSPSQPLHSPLEAIPSFLGSIPIRKRPICHESDINLLNQQRSYTVAANQNMVALNMSRAHVQTLHAFKSIPPPLQALTVQKSLTAPMPTPPQPIHQPPCIAEESSNPVSESSSSSSSGASTYMLPVKVSAQLKPQHEQHPLPTQSPSSSSSAAAAAAAVGAATPPQNQPPKRTGFSIEDIMRR